MTKKQIGYKAFALAACTALAINISAQEKWTLASCIEYAREKNIQVQKSKLTVESYEVDVMQSKAALFPSLSGTVSQNFNNSQTDEKGDGNYRYKGLFTGNYGLNANWTIYNGNRNRNAVKQSKLQKDAEELNTQNIQNNIEISIAQAYLQILYTRESIKNDENILASSEAQLKQSKDFLDAGSITMSEYAQVEAQYSSYKYDLVVAQNSFDNYKLQLKQLLELDYNTNFDLDFPDINDNLVLQLLPEKYEVYETALNLMPEIKNSKLGIDIANLGISTAKAGRLPTIALSGNLGTSNVYNESPGFFKQFGRNFTQGIGISLSIPIFDNSQNKANIQKANIEYQTAELNLIDAQKTLLKTIEGLYQDAVSAQSKYVAAKDKLKSAELSYQLMKEQYDLGLSSTLEMTTEKNNYANALQELLQAKYTALISIKLLDFYQGKTITI
ncbi:MAG: TolC family protein [Dysgonomonas sp.]